jgi:hypothetical protein
MRGVLYTEFWWGTLRERGNLEHLGVDVRIILKLIFKKFYGTWRGLIWLKIGRHGRLLLMGS